MTSWIDDHGRTLARNGVGTAGIALRLLAVGVFVALSSGCPGANPGAAGTGGARGGTGGGAVRDAGASDAPAGSIAGAGAGANGRSTGGSGGSGPGGIVGGDGGGRSGARTGGTDGGDAGSSGRSGTGGTPQSGTGGRTDPGGPGGMGGLPGGGSGASGGTGPDGDRGGAGGATTAPGAGGSAASGTGGNSARAGCPRPGLLFCDDFESAPLGVQPQGRGWSTAIVGEGSIAVEASLPAHSGARSVHVTGAGYQTFFVLSGPPLFPTASGKVYLRAYLRLAVAMTEFQNGYFTAGPAAMADTEHETRVGVMNGMLMIDQSAGTRIVLSNQSYYQDGGKPGVQFLPRAWVCVETFLDPLNRTIDVWVDGKEVPDLHLTDWQQDSIGALRFGYERNGGLAVELWYDDIAVSNQRIGC